MSVMRFESSRAISVMSTKKVEEEPQAARVAENSPGGSNSWFIISMSAQASTSYHISSFNLTLREKKKSKSCFHQVVLGPDSYIL